MNPNTDPITIADLLFVFLVALSASVILGMIVFVTLIKPFMQRGTKKTKESVSITPNSVALIHRNGECIRVENSQHYKLGKDETAVVQKLCEQCSALPSHSCYTSDRIKITVNACVIWQIIHMEAFVNGTPEPQFLLQMTVLPALTEAIAGCKLDALTGNMGNLAGQAKEEANRWLSRHGLMLHKLSIATLDLPEPKPPGKPEAHNEAERLTSLNTVVPAIDEKTLKYAQLMKAMELASAREAAAKKD